MSKLGSKMDATLQLIMEQLNKLGAGQDELKTTYAKGNEN
jgi:hypothetical protein